MKIDFYVLLTLLFISNSSYASAHNFKIDFNEYYRYSYFDALSSIPLTENLKSPLNIPDKIGPLEIQFQGGDTIKRNAKIVPNPTNLADNALKFTVNEANCCNSKRGRIQVNAYGLKDIPELTYSVDMYLPKSQDLIRSFPGQMNFYTISEWWNDTGWNGDFPFRISLNIVKKTAEESSPLIFEVRSQIKQEEKKQPWQGYVWEERNDAYIIPTGKWIRLTYHYVEGDNDHGKFELSVTEDEQTIQIFSINNWTHHPQNNNSNGLVALNPIKLYVGHQLIDHLVYNLEPIEIYWDNLHFNY